MGRLCLILLALFSLAGVGSATQYKCLWESVGYRNSKDMKDRAKVKPVHFGEIVDAVLVEKDWFKTSNGFWLPLTHDGAIIFKVVVASSDSSSCIYAGNVNYESDFS